MDYSLSLFDGLLFTVILLYLLYLYGTWTYDYFSKRNVQFIKPLPFLGNSKSFLFRKENQHICNNHAYTDIPGKRITGYFELRNPMYMVRDPDQIKQIGVKDFDHFVDHRTILDSNQDPIFGNILLALKGQKWRDMRATLSPAFTGSKMKLMYSLVSDCAQQMADYLVTKSKSDPLEVEMKDLFTKYTNDVIATAAFGIKVDSLNDPNNEFYLMGKRFSNFTSLKIAIKFLGYLIIPSIMKFFKIPMSDKMTNSFFRHLVLTTMKTREKENIIRPDMIHLLMQARKGTLTHETEMDEKDAGFATVKESNIGRAANKRIWTDDELIAQVSLFFLAGFDTTSTLLCFTAHELAVNPNVQKRLLKEIDNAKQEGIPTYESIQKLKYLDMVVSESLRKWPPLPTVDRVCVKNYVVSESDGNPDLTIEEGSVITIPIFAIHHDSQYYPNPEQFDPERFSDENKKNINQFTYLPFGVGPRNCIGSRFALMEAKAVLFHILSEFSFEIFSKTMVPLEVNKKGVTMAPEEGFWLQLKRRANYN